jgi:hypothetical protein
LKSLISLWKMVAQECATVCHTSITRDLKTVTCRCEHEGLSFLTITLPSFGKATEKSLDLGRVDLNLFKPFASRGGLPVFLSGFLDRVFDRTSGVLLDDPDIEAIRAIRQLTLMFGKMNLPCTPERERAAFDGYIQCEKEVRANDAKLNSSHRDEFSRIARMLFAGAFTTVDRKIYNGEMSPVKHGPGSTADKLSSNAKFQLRSWPERLEYGNFPFGEFNLPNWSYYDVLDDVHLLEPGSEVPVKVISVPKTLKTPRIIGMEPAAMQYAQQSVLPLILNALNEVDYLSSMLGFDDQEPNQLMAREGSLCGDLATLDLSEASDRVSNQHVRLLLDRHQHLSDAVDACRSRKADVPGHGVQRLAKFASMGSALCFPFEAMVFLTVIFLGIQKSLNTSLTLKDVKSLKGSVRVYGDDIIVPVDHVSSVVDMLHTFGYVVNVSKSFWNGKFRESCGKEYYDGHDVSIVKVRHMFPTQPKHATEVISIVSLRNQLYWLGFWQTCRWLDDYILRVIKYFPVVESSSPVLGRESVLPYQAERTHRHLHSPIVKGWVVSSVAPRDYLEGPGALLKCHLLAAKRDVEEPGLDWLRTLYPPTVDETHLERAGRPHVVRIKLRSSTPF